MLTFKIIIIVNCLIYCIFTCPYTYFNKWLHLFPPIIAKHKEIKCASSLLHSIVYFTNWMDRFILTMYIFCDQFRSPCRCSLLVITQFFIPIPFCIIVISLFFDLYRFPPYAGYFYMCFEITLNNSFNLFKPILYPHMCTQNSCRLQVVTLWWWEVWGRGRKKYCKNIAFTRPLPLANRVQKLLDGYLMM